MPTWQPAHVMASDRSQPLRLTTGIRGLAMVFAVFAMLCIVSLSLLSPLPASPTTSP